MKTRVPSIMAVACLSLVNLTGTHASAHTIEFIVGQRAALVFTDFTASADGTTFSSTVPTAGVLSGPLNFEVLAYTSGHAGYDTGFRCARFAAPAGGPAALEPSSPPACHLTWLSPAQQLVYNVEVSLACSGIPITQGSVNDVRPLDAATRDAIVQSIDRNTGAVQLAPGLTSRMLTALGPDRQPTLRGVLQDGQSCSSLEITVRMGGGSRLENAFMTIYATQSF